MAAVNTTRANDRKLHLREVLDWMVEDGMLTAPPGPGLGAEPELDALDRWRAA